jgi:hypothetical protein
MGAYSIVQNREGKDIAQLKCTSIQRDSFQDVKHLEFCLSIPGAESLWWDQVCLIPIGRIRTDLERRTDPRCSRMEAQLLYNAPSAHSFHLSLSDSISFCLFNPLTKLQLSILLALSTKKKQASNYHGADRSFCWSSWNAGTPDP